MGEDSKGSKTLVVQPSQLGALEVESIRVLKAENDELRMRVVALEVRRGPVISLGANGAGLGLGGIALAGAVLVSRRKRGEGSDAK